jgi:hypothetical protein
MAYITTTKPALSLGSIVARPFVAIWNFLIMLAEANPRMAAIAKLNALSDAELEARGTDRSAEVRRIFASQCHI